MRISEAVYTMASIQRANSSQRPRVAESAKSPDSGAAVPAGGSKQTTSNSKPPAGPPVTRDLADMLHKHFAEELRLRDRDHDGFLSQTEYAGTPEEFQALDRDADGRISTFDLVQAALQRNQDLSEIVAGPWAPIYHAILNAPASDARSLDAAAKTGAQEVADQELEVANSTWNPSAKADAIATFNVETIISEFLARHDRLDLLRARLDDLAARLSRKPQYQPIDHIA